MRMLGLGAFVAFSVITFGGIASAAPQLLGVIAATEPAKLTCADNECMAQLATFCMQSHRETPDRKQLYKAHEMDAFKIVAEDREGNRVQLALSDMEFRAVRGFTAVDVTIPRSAIDGEELRAVGLQVRKTAMLIPVVADDDPSPISESEIDRALTFLQPVATDVFKKHGVEYEAVQLINRLVNEAPAKGRMAKARRGNLWEETFGESPRESVGEGAHRAADILGYCQYRTKRGRFFSVRRCLEQRLDGMIMELNTDYWKAVQPGT